MELNRIHLLFFITLFIGFASTIFAQNTCSSPDVITNLPYAQTGLTTCGAENNYIADWTCGSAYMNGEDYVFEYTADQTGCHLFNIYNTSNWTGLFVLDGCPDTPTTNCVEFATSQDGNPTLSTDLVNGTTYYVVVSTWPSPNCTDFDIYIDQCIAGNDCDTPYTITGTSFSETNLTTCSVDNSFGGGAECGSNYMLSNDFVFEFTPDSTKCYIIDITNTASYVGAFILTDCPSSVFAVCLASDTPGSLGNPTLELELTADETYTIVVSSQETPNSCTDFDINISTGPCPEPEPNDCINALPICSNGLLNFNSNGTGQNDFFPINNESGCLSLEHQSAWYVVQIGPEPEDAGEFAFTINPIAGSGEDYDFAVYGPNITCDNLGSPLRCSFASDNCTFCPQTGLGNGANDFSENPSGDGFVAPIDALPGEIYYILVDNFESSSSGFDLIWTGDAILDCGALPPCDFEAHVGENQAICLNSDNFQLEGSIVNSEAGLTYSWTSIPIDAVNYLINANTLTPTFDIGSLPANFHGQIIYTLEVSNGDCHSLDNMAIIVDTADNPPNGDTPIEYCVGSTVAALSGTPHNSGTIKWYDADPSLNTLSPIHTGNSFLPSVGTSPSDHIDNTNIGTTSFWITETPTGGCETLPFQIEVVFIAQPELASIADQVSCTDNFDLSSIAVSDINGLNLNTANISFHEDSAGNPGNAIAGLVNQSGQYWIMVDLAGCTDAVAFHVTLGTMELTINTADASCGEQDGAATVIANMGTSPYTYQWNSTPPQNTATASNLAQGTYFVTVTDANDCTATEQTTVNVPEIPDAIAANDGPLCEGASLQLTASTSSTADAIYYNWSGPNGFASTEQNPVLTNTDASFSGSYSLTIIADECSSPEEITEVIVYEQPDAIVNGNMEICDGTTIQLTGSTTNTSNDLVYQWTGPDSFASTEQNPTFNNISLNQSGTYTLIVSANGCASEAASTEITIHQSPNIDDNIPLQSSCNGSFDIESILITDANNSSPTITYHEDNAGMVGANLTHTIINQSGSYWILAENSICADSVMVTLDIFNEPIADFTLSETELCADGSSEVTITFTGTVTNESDATFNWNFDGGTIVTGSGIGPYTISWSDAGIGTATISLGIEENECLSDIATQTITLYTPLPPLVVNCSDSSPNFVEFDWNDVSGATGYSISYTINGEMPPVTDNTTNTNYEINGLSPDDVIEINVTALSDGLCGNSNTSTAICTADDCPVINPTITLSSIYCNDHLPISLSATPSGGTFTINGTAANNFDPSTAALETPHLVEYTYTDSATDCVYTATKNVYVYAVPTAEFNLSSATLCAEGTNEITVTYTGTGGSNTQFNWSFGDATILSGTGSGPYTLTWDSGTGSQDISLVVTQNNCTSPIHIETIFLSQPLEVPNVNCTDIGVNNIVFDWQNIEGAFGYTVSYSINGNIAIEENTSDSVFEVENLEPESVVEISVMALGFEPCGDSEIGTVACEVLNCPPMSIGISDFENQFCVEASSVSLSAEPSGGIFSGSGVSGSTLNPSNAEIGEHILTYTYTDTNGCDYSTTTPYIVNSVPTSSFDLDPFLLCADGTSEATIVFTGNTYSENPIFNWNFNGGVLVSGSGAGPLTVVWSNMTGMANVSLNITENGCTSTITTESISLHQPLDPPTVICAETTNNSVRFEWQHVDFALSYEITYTINDGEPITISSPDPYLDVTDLNLGDVVNIEVVPVGDEPCGNGPAGIAECTVEDCPELEVSIDSLADSYCSDEPIVILEGTPEGGTFSGLGVTGNEFDPATIAKENTIVQYTYIDPDTGCTYNTSMNVNVIAVPIAEFEIVPNTLCADGNMEAIITFTGVADLNASFNWDFGGGIANPATGSGPHTVVWEDAQTTDEISLMIDNEGCISESFSQNVTLAAPIENFQVSCSTATTSSVSFDWADVLNAEGYEIRYSINGQNLTNSISINNSHFTIGDLAIQDSVQIFVTAIATEPCASIEVSAICTTIDCPDIELTISDLNESYCSNESIFELSALPEGGIFVGQGIEGTNTFNPSAAIVGTNNIEYQYTDADSGCEYSLPFEITVEAPLTTPLVNCSESTQNSITFNWNMVNNAINYQITYTINNGNEITEIVENPPFEVNGLSPQDEVNISVVAIGEGVCGNSEAGFTNCIAQDCEAIDLVIEGLEAEYCSDAEAVTLMANIDGGFFAINGNESTTFDPAILGEGTHLIEYILQQGECSYNTNLNIEVIEPIEALNINCGNSTTNSVSFNWNEAIGYAFEVTYTINGENPTTTTTSDNTFEVTDLNPQDEVEITVVILNDGICGNSPASSQTCIAQDCETLDLVIEGLEAEYCSDAEAVTLTANIEGGTFTINGNESTTFDPAILGGGTHLIEYSLQQGNCSYSTSVNIEVVEPLEAVLINCESSTTNSVSFSWGETIGYAFEVTYTVNGENPITTTTSNNTFEVTDLSPQDEVELTVVILNDGICGDSLASSQTCIAQDCEALDLVIEDLEAEYCSDADAVILTANIEGGTFTINGNESTTFDPAILGGGTHLIEYILQQGECSYNTNLNIEVIEPIEAVNINCGNSTTNSVSFNWSEAIGYAFEVTYTINGENPTTTTTSDNTFEVTNLNPQDEVEISVIVLNNGICGNNPANSQTCIAQDCEAIDLVIEGLEAEYCSDAEAVILMANIEGGIFTINGNESTTFDPAILGGGTHLIEYSLQQGNCSYSTSVNIEVVEPLEAVLINCESSTTNSVSFSWGEVAGYDFEVVYTINGENPITTTTSDNTFEVTNLNPQDEVEISVIVLNNGICGNNPANSQTCIAQDCEAIDLVIEGLEAEYCSDAEAVILMANIEGGIFTINGNESTVFDPSILGGGTHLIEYILQQGECNYNASVNVEVIQPLEAVTITCGNSTTNSVSFNWNEAIGYAFEVTYTINGENPTTTTTSDNTFEVTNLNPQDEVEISVIVLNDGICGNSPVSSQTCIAQDCETLDLVIEGLEDEYCSDADVVILTANIEGGIFTINGNESTIFTPAILGEGTHLIEYILQQGECSYNTSLEIEVIESLEAVLINCESSTTNSVSFNWSEMIGYDFEVTYTVNGENPITTTTSNNTFEITDLSPQDEIETTVVILNDGICGNSPASSQTCIAQDCEVLDLVIEGLEAEYCSDAEAVTLMANIDGGFFAINGNESTTFDPAILGEGTHLIEYTLQQGNCSYSTSVSIEVVEPLEVVLINCGNSTTNSVSFSWGEVAGYDFEVTYTINGENPTTTTTSDNSLEVTDLSPQDEVEISVVILNGGICGNSPATSQICIAQDCEVVDLVIEDLEDEYCSDADAVILMANIEGGTFFINGEESSLFEPLNLGSGTHLIEYILQQGECDYSTSLNIDIVEPLDAVEINCANSTPNSVSFNWSEANGYDFEVVYTVNDENPITRITSDNSLEVTDLNPLDEVEISVIVLNDGICGDSSLEIHTCSTLACPEISWNLPVVACLDEVVRFDLMGGFGENTQLTWASPNGTLPQLESPDSYTINWNQGGWQYLYLEAMDENGCEAAISDSVFVSDLYVESSADTSVLYASTLELESFVEGAYQGDLTYLWTASTDEILSCEDCPILPIAPLEPTTYTLSVIDENGCSAMTSVLVDVIYENRIAVPTAFSPNGDGINDVFQVSGLNIESVELVVYNRWGKEVFRTQDVNAGWDGIFGGENQPIGTYAYYAMVRFEDGVEELVRGNLTLIR